MRGRQLRREVEEQWPVLTGCFKMRLDVTESRIPYRGMDEIFQGHP